MFLQRYHNCHGEKGNPDRCAIAFPIKRNVRQSLSVSLSLKHVLMCVRVLLIVLLSGIAKHMQLDR